MEDAGHYVIGDRDRAQRGVHRPAVERCAGRGFGQQFSGVGEAERVDVIAEDPPQRLHAARLRRAAIAASGVVVRHTFEWCRATSPGAKL